MQGARASGEGTCSGLVTGRVIFPFLCARDSSILFLVRGRLASPVSLLSSPTFLPVQSSQILSSSREVSLPI